MTYDEAAHLCLHPDSLELLHLWQLVGVADPPPGELIKVLFDYSPKRDLHIVSSRMTALNILEEHGPGGGISQQAWAVLLGSPHRRTREVAVRLYSR